MNIRKDYIPGVPRVPYVGLKPTTIVLHEVGNQKSTLANEVKYVKGHWEDAFYHYLVDHTEAVELCDPNYLAYGAGPKINGYAIHIELVRDNGKNFAQAYRNYIDLAVLVGKRFGIQPTFNRSRAGFVTHHWVSENLGGTDHSDPDDWLAANGVSLQQFETDILETYNGDNDVLITKENQIAELFRLGYFAEPKPEDLKSMMGLDLEDAVRYMRTNPVGQSIKAQYDAAPVLQAQVVEQAKQIEELLARLKKVQTASVEGFEPLNQQVYVKKEVK